jgi:DMSO/TMAO reductase YedYZ heme-binding membrane subunit
MTIRAKSASLEGWGLLRTLILAISLWSLATWLLWGGEADAARAVIRATARISLLLFLAAFLASSLQRLVPGEATSWLRRNRRQLGLGFAWSHFVHLLFIFLYWRLDAPAFLEGRTPGSFVPGTIGYLLIAALAVTSFDRTARAIGPRAWKLLHKAGVWYIFLLFAISLGKRAEANSLYLGFLVIMAVALLVRLAALIAAWRKTIPKPA